MMNQVQSITNEQLDWIGLDWIGYSTQLDLTIIELITNPSMIS